MFLIQVEKEFDMFIPRVLIYGNREFGDIV